MNVNPAGNKISSPATVAAAPATGTKLQVNRATAQAVTAVNSAQLFGQNNELTFAVDRASKKTVIRLVDKNTGDVVRQIPSETILHLAEGLKGE